jgi:hypothetical protein
VGEKLKNLACSLIGVFGNNDGEKDGLTSKITSIGGELHTSPYSFTYAGKKILLLHDPAKLKKMDISSFQIIVYGHTHKEEIKKENSKLFVNPGECGGWLTGRSTVALVNLETMEVRVYELPSVN